ncbi:hypothetical protein DK847_00180 [Aestuariivirga litoralis]|uniref:Small-conductance mechanosensitive channel n=1 Tax=Aestuariivirga litoralis TaxID=2650924 RepID=A0A2W2B069_9HYPH|nr:mechanosensitive ion channel domain-containing protein [Aestuariivirga litoralis]PZF78280.1 hypothetical protein DK847_00180 [Aestuariivirga litoralis]
MSKKSHVKVTHWTLHRVARVFASVALLALLVLSHGAAMAENPAAPSTVSGTESPAPEPAPTTTADPGIALDDLEIMLEPLTRAEVAVEAKAWLALLRAKVSEISLAELAVHRKNREIAQLAKEKAAGDALAKAAQEAKSKESSTDTTAAEKVAAAERLAAAQKDLANTVDSAEKQAASDQEQASAAASVASAKTAEAAKVSSAVGQVAKAGDGTDPVAAAVEQKATDPAAAPEVAASIAKEAAVPSADGSGSGISAEQTSNKAVQLSEKASEATGAKTDVKVALVDLSTQLTSERTALADRLKLVLDKWELKGGDPAEYRQYVSSLSGFKIDVSDRTATWARTKAWLVADEGGLRWSRNLGIFLGYVLGSVIIAWILRRVLRRAMNVTHVSSNLLRDFVVSMSGRAVVFFGVLLGLSALEFNLSPILAAVGAAGFVVAFALQGTLSNFASGLLIMVNKPFDVGDIVEIGSGIKGKVQAVTIFSTVAEKEDGLTMIVPNNTVWSGVITNYSTSVISNASASG